MGKMAGRKRQRSKDPNRIFGEKKGCLGSSHGLFLVIWCVVYIHDVNLCRVVCDVHTV